MARGGGVYITLHFGRFLFLEKILAFTVVDYSLGGRSGVPLVARGVRDGWGPGFEAGAGAGAGATIVGIKRLVEMPMPDAPVQSLAIW